VQEGNSQQWYFITGYIRYGLYRKFLLFDTSGFKTGEHMNEIARKKYGSSPEQKERVLMLQYGAL